MSAVTLADLKQAFHDALFHCLLYNHSDSEVRQLVEHHPAYVGPDEFIDWCDYDDNGDEFYRRAAKALIAAHVYVIARDKGFEQAMLYKLQNGGDQ